MISRWFRLLLLPLVLAAGVSACANSSAVSPGVQTVAAAAPPGSGIGDAGRVVSIRDIEMKGGSGGGQGPLMGGLIGGGAGAVVGSSITRGGGLVGLVIGAIGGAIAGTIYDRHSGTGRGLEVTIQKDDGQTLIIAQRDDGELQLGDRVVVIDDNGVAKAVRDNRPRTD